MAHATTHATTRGNKTYVVIGWTAGPNNDWRRADAPVTPQGTTTGWIYGWFSAGCNNLWHCVFFKSLLLQHNHGLNVLEKSTRCADYIRTVNMEYVAFCHNSCDIDTKYNQWLNLLQHSIKNNWTIIELKERFHWCPKTARQNTTCGWVCCNIQLN